MFVEGFVFIKTIDSGKTREYLRALLLQRVHASFVPFVLQEINFKIAIIRNGFFV